MNHFIPRTITVSETFSERIGAATRQPYTGPLFLDIAPQEAPSSLETYRATWLSSDEERQFQRFRLEKRKREWLAGRICAKSVVRDFLRIYHPDYPLPYAADIQIANSSAGRPYVTGLNSRKQGGWPDISISHSTGLVLALAAETCCGVDIQKTSDTLLRVKKRFCTDQETRLLLSSFTSADSLMTLTLLWAAKEAVKKALGIDDMPGFLDLVLIQVEPAGDEGAVLTFSRNRNKPPSAITACAARFGSHGLGICIP